MEAIEKYLDKFFQELDHTPAPWSIEDQGGNSMNIHTSADNYEEYEICAVWNAGPECLQLELQEEAKANSKLITEAPRMLRTICRTYLLMLVKFHHGINETVTSVRISMDGTLANLRNDISMATGLECQHIQDTFEEYANIIHNELD